MNKVVECVPNFSEGRDKNIINQILDTIKSIQGVTIWDSSSDASHNRTVVTFVGSPDAVKKAAIKSALKAAELIDMKTHAGGHPRIGAVDVIPFVPLVGTTLDECVEIANEVGRTLSKELDAPVYMYGEAAKKLELKNLGYVQNIQYEGLIDKIEEDDYLPDYGPNKMNLRTGGLIVGARNILVAFNVNLGTDDLSIAKKIAKSIRESGHGLRNVKSMGVDMKEKGIVQVSMDMVDYKRTPLYQPYELIKIEAERWGIPVIGSELIGLVPTDALINSSMYYLKLHDFTMDQLIEKQLYNF